MCGLGGLVCLGGECGGHNDTNEEQSMARDSRATLKTILVLFGHAHNVLDV